MATLPGSKPVLIEDEKNIKSTVKSISDSEKVKQVK